MGKKSEGKWEKNGENGLQKGESGGGEGRRV